ncbi:MAG TPA: PQQ-dependent sugar dehydrogenase [Archangium sp.]|uniref:PQQ-dependent sugar dehydrogenase n=1 Tax=Archangium sp. TaxID=1872627 RepID=UPI002E2F99F4|nr:PQQ-dependent sugar dehydrogenase [Archangium sp.]HEX5751651.1 PQQ-dependent sugar dehydrogenase [Archangium sp.]
MSTPARGASPVLPGGFSDEVFISGLEVPTAFVPLPDGRFLITEKEGVVRIHENGVLLPTPLLDIRERVNSTHDRGLMSLAVDPEFAANGFIYLLYTYDDDAWDDFEPKVGRLARYTVVGNTASPTSEVILLGTQVAASCNDLPAGSDCIPSDSPSHSIGHLEFAPDGTLFVTLGDGAEFSFVDDNALRAQDLDSLAGKLLHITRFGEGLPTNPFWTGEARANRSKVFSYGLRNAYRFHLRPDTGRPYLGDVGWGQYEELNVATPGANFGWPCYEGPEPQGGYAPKPACQALYARGASAVKPPLYFWSHNGGSACATAGFFYTGTDYPSAYWGAFFFGDYVQSWLRTLRVDENDDLVPGSVTFFADAHTPAAISPGPGGDVYYVAIAEGQVRRIRYTAGNTPPTVVASAAPSNGYAPLLVRFSSEGTGDPDGDLLEYSWDFGDGTGSNLAHPEHTYTANGDYTARLTVSDRRGGTRSASVAIVVGNLAPVVTITSPAHGSSFKVGDVITWSGEASDAEDGRLPADRLSWIVTLHHCIQGTCHAHPYSASTGASGSLLIPDHGDEFYFDLTLSASDSGGLTARHTVSIYPRTVQLTLETVPSGLRVLLNGQSGTAPLTRTAVAGSRNTVSAPSPQEPYEFQGWSDGGALEHQVEAGETSATYTATFARPVPAECPEGQFRAEYFNNPWLGGEPVMVRCEPAPLSYDWGLDSPAPEVAADHFSVRWTGWFSLNYGTYRFTARADDGVRVDVDGSRVIDAWRDQGPTTYSGLIFLWKGRHRVIMEYYENGGGAVSQLGWRRL